MNWAWLGLHACILRFLWIILIETVLGYNSLVSWIVTAMSWWESIWWSVFYEIFKFLLFNELYPLFLKNNLLILRKFWWIYLTVFDILSLLRWTIRAVKIILLHKLAVLQVPRKEIVHLLKLSRLIVLDCKVIEIFRL